MLRVVVVKSPGHLMNSYCTAVAPIDINIVQIIIRDLSRDIVPQRLSESVSGFSVYHCNAAEVDFG